MDAPPNYQTQSISMPIEPKIIPILVQSSNTPRKDYTENFFNKRLDSEIVIAYHTPSEKRARQKAQHALIRNYLHYSEKAFNKVFEEGDVESLFESILNEIEMRDKGVRIKVDFIE